MTRERKAIKENAENKVLPDKLFIQTIQIMETLQMREAKDHKVQQASRVLPVKMALTERMV